MAGTLAFALLFQPLSDAGAESDQLLATIDKPAEVTLQLPADSQSGAATASRRIVVEVTGFRPALDNSAVQAVVNARKPDGTEEEIGRFGIFPQAEFQARSPSEGRKFALSVPAGIGRDGPLNLKIELLPLRGSGAGASLQVGRIDWEALR